MTPIRRAALVVTAACALLAWPAVASAQSELDQYVPTVPGANGDNPVGGHGGGHGGSGGGGGGASGGGGAGATGGGATLAPATAAGHQAQGTEGASVAPTSGSVGSDSRSTDSISTGSQAGHGDTGGGKSPVGATIDTLSGDSADGGMGILLPIVLVATLALGIVYALKQRRSFSE
jgi:hypothetical protein